MRFFWQEIYHLICLSYSTALGKRKFSVLAIGIITLMKTVNLILPSLVLAEQALFSLHYHPASHSPGIVYFLANWYLIETKLHIYNYLA